MQRSERLQTKSECYVCPVSSIPREREKQKHVMDLKGCINCLRLILMRHKRLNQSRSFDITRALPSLSYLAAREYILVFFPLFLSFFYFSRILVIVPYSHFLCIFDAVSMQFPCDWFSQNEIYYGIWYLHSLGWDLLWTNNYWKSRVILLICLFLLQTNEGTKFLCIWSRSLSSCLRQYRFEVLKIEVAEGI